MQLIKEEIVLPTFFTCHLVGYSESIGRPFFTIRHSICGAAIWLSDAGRTSGGDGFPARHSCERELPIIYIPELAGLSAVAQHTPSVPEPCCTSREMSWRCGDCERVMCHRWWTWRSCPGTAARRCWAPLVTASWPPPRRCATSTLFSSTLSNTPARPLCTRLHPAARVCPCCRRWKELSDLH